MMAAYVSPWNSRKSLSAPAVTPFSPKLSNKSQLPDFAGVFRGRELTRKARRLASGIAALDALLDGGIARGRVSEIIGRPGTGRTSLAAAFAANATGRGEVIAWIDAAGAFDPTSIAAAGVELARVLWASIPQEASRARPVSSREGRVLKAAEMVLEAGGFGLVVIDFGDIFRAIPDSAVLRIARAAERSGAAVIAIAPRRICGTFAALSLTMNRAGASFSRIRPGAPALFDGLKLEPVITRNKLGGSGAITRIVAAIDPQYRTQRVQNFPRNSPLPPGEGNAASSRVGEGERPITSLQGSPSPESRAARTEQPSPSREVPLARGRRAQRAGEGAALRGKGLGRSEHAVASNHPERPLPTGDARHPPRIGEGIRKNTDQNFNRAPLRSALNNDPHLTSPFQGEEIDAGMHGALEGSSPCRVPAAPPF
ncbi:MAG: ATPase domain-containing protein, partial [Candidatus Binataceae bacterium]